MALPIGAIMGFAGGLGKSIFGGIQTRKARKAVEERKARKAGKERKAGTGGKARKAGKERNLNQRNEN